MWSRKVASLPFYQRSMCDHRPQAIGDCDQQGCNNTVPVVIVHYAVYSVCILYKPGPNLYIADWLSQNNHMENKGPGNHRHEC